RPRRPCGSTSLPWQRCRRGSGRRTAAAPRRSCRRSSCSSFRGLVDLGEERAEIGGLSHVEFSAAVLGRQAPGISGAANKAACGALVGIVPPAARAFRALVLSEEVE